MESSLNKELLEKFKKAFYVDEKNILSQNVCSRQDPFEVSLSRKKLEETQNIFNHKIESEAKPITHQKNSGRCWLFAALNVMRLPFMKQLNIEDFEFSQAYLFFWDKIERCNFFLHTIVEAAKRNESVDGRLISFLLQVPANDGGQWDMLVNLIQKHGIMPKKCFPESFSCESSGRLNQLLKSKLREYAKELYGLVTNGINEADVQNTIEKQMLVIYRIVGICLGIPNETFTWTYYDKNKNFHCIGPITPKEFYENHVKPVFNVESKICLVTDPRPTNQYGRVYTIDCLGNVLGGRKCIYNNQPVETLMELVTKSIKENEAVWFGCEVSKRFASKQGIQDLAIHDFKLVFGTDIQITMSKADRLLYGESAMSHAMVFTAVYEDNNGDVKKFRVENSWGEDRGDKGYLIMTDDWFKEFVFEVVIDKKFVPQSILDVFKQEPIVLPAWDPMGTLASAK
ncbi:bleomycin hydrolase [Agrilus planipennis]|uniref:Bleomycin hydrolase n=1 Tax=Agrilus planipennis TaxID=224129 RepID=A0A1W4X2M9_AGRPL|nr:bleomycin hydrolase [Agrilus planipennis]